MSTNLNEVRELMIQNGDGGGEKTVPGERNGLCPGLKAGVLLAHLRNSKEDPCELSEARWPGRRGAQRSNRSVGQG